MNIISVLYSELSNTYIIDNITYKIHNNNRENLRQFSKILGEIVDYHKPYY